MSERQVRAELRTLAGETLSPEIVVVAGEGAQIDRPASGRTVEAIEGKLRTRGAA